MHTNIFFFKWRIRPFEMGLLLLKFFVTLTQTFNFKNQLDLVQDESVHPNNTGVVVVHQMITIDQKV